MAVSPPLVLRSSLAALKDGRAFTLGPGLVFSAATPCIRVVAVVSTQRARGITPLRSYLFV